MSRSTRNCVVPLVVRLRGVPSDERLAETSDAIARTIAGRLLEANHVIAAREGWQSWHRNYAAPEFRFSGASLDDDLQRRVTAAIEGGIARALAGRPVAASGQPQFVLAKYPAPATKPAAPARKAPPQRHRRSVRGWRILAARDFYTTVNKYTEFFDMARNPPVKLFDLYAIIGEQRRRVALWVVQVDRGYWLPDLLHELLDRATQLINPRADQVVASIVGATETDRKKLIAIDDSGVAQQTIPDLTSNRSHLQSIHDNMYALPGARVFLAVMVLPKIRLADYLRTEPGITLSLRYRDLEFLINVKGFEGWFGVTWAGFVALYGDLPATLHILEMEVLRPAPMFTIEALVEDATQVGTPLVDARNLWRFEPLSRSFVASFPEPVKQAVAGYANSTSLALSDEDQYGTWRTGWRAAMLWARFEVTADHRFAILNQTAATAIADRLIAHLGTSDKELVWWFGLRHILDESFNKYQAPAGVRTLFDLVMEQLEARENGRWFAALLDILATNDGETTRAFLECAFASTNYRDHPRIVAIRAMANVNWRDALLNAYFPETGVIWLKEKSRPRWVVGPRGVIADAYSDFSDEYDAKMLVESRRAEFEKALSKEGEKLVAEIVKGQTSADFDVTEFTNEVVKRASQAIKLSDSDFETVTVTVSYRVTKIELRSQLGLEHYALTWNLVKRIDNGPWEDVPGTERETGELELEWSLRMWETSRNVDRLAKIGLIAAVIGLAVIAWEAGIVSALVRLAGGATTLLSAVALSEIIYLVTAKHYSLEGFVWAAIEGYINAVTFRFAGLGGGAIAGRIGTSSMTRLIGGWIARRLFTGVVGGAAGAAFTTFAHGVAGVLLGNGKFPTFGDFVRAMELGAVMGCFGEFILGPALQGAFRLGGQTALTTIAEAVKLIRDGGVSPAEYAAQIGEALGGMRQRLAQFLEENSVTEIMAALRERLAGLGEALANVPGAAKRRLELGLFRQVFELAEMGLGRAETDGLERLLAASESGAVRMTREELLTFLNGLARDHAQASRVLQGLGRLAEDRVAALIASGQLDALAGASHLLQHLPVVDIDLIWEVWNGGSFGFRIADFDLWLGRIGRHGNDQQVFALELLRRPSQDITPEGLAQALDKGGLSSETVLGLDRLYGAFDDVTLADAILRDVPGADAATYLRFVGRLPQASVDQLADRGLLHALSGTPRVLEFAARDQNLEVLQQVVAGRGTGPAVAQEVLESLEQLLTRETSLSPEQQLAAVRQLFGSPKLANVAQLDRLLGSYGSVERLTRLLEAHEVHDGAQLERLADVLHQSKLPDATTGALSQEQLTRLANPAVLGQMEPTAVLEGAGRLKGLGDWLKFNAEKSLHELTEATRELREAGRLANDNPAAIVHIGREAHAPIRPGTTEAMPEFDITLEIPGGTVQRSVEVTTVQNRVANFSDLTNAVRHAADKVASRAGEGAPIPGAHDVIIEMELAVGRRAVDAGTVEILPNGTKHLITGDGRTIRSSNLFDDFAMNLPRIQDNALLDQITLVDPTGHPFATFERAAGAWTRRP
jgi:hypothetical protein